MRVRRRRVSATYGAAPRTPVITRRSRRRRDAIFIAVASLVLGIGTTAALAAAFNNVPTLWASGPMLTRPAQPMPCAAPSLPGAAVDVSLTDMGGMMGPGGMMGGGGMMGPGMMSNGQGWNGNGMPGMRMMQMTVNPRTVPAGEVSLMVYNRGFVAHEAVVMPLNTDQAAGQRPIGPDGKIDESGSLGEASRTCGAGEGEGIAPGTLGWTTLTLAPGRYEVLCNIAGHYRWGMYTELDVTPSR